MCANLVVMSPSDIVEKFVTQRSRDGGKNEER